MKANKKTPPNLLKSLGGVLQRPDPTQGFLSALAGLNTVSGQIFSFNALMAPFMSNTEMFHVLSHH
jgi:hypothetical protein